MEDNLIFAEKPREEAGEKKTHVPSLVLGILSIVLGLFVALAGEILALVGFIQVSKHKETHNTKPSRICCIVGFWLSLINHILGIVMLLFL